MNIIKKNVWRIIVLILCLHTIPKSSSQEVGTESLMQLGNSNSICLEYSPDGKMFVTGSTARLLNISDSNNSVNINANRVFLPQGYQQGQTLSVEISIEGDAGSYDMMETVPAGWKIVTIENGGTIEDNVIRWQIQISSLPIIVSYWIQASSEATEPVTFSGTIADQEIGGMQTMPPLDRSALVHYPPVSGPYKVGRVSRHLIDESRLEEFSSQNDDKRELMVDIWYPADIREGEQQGMWSPSPEFDFNQRIWSLLTMSFQTVRPPNFFWDSFASLVVNSYPEALIFEEQKKYPVIIYSPGWLVNRHCNTYLMEDLASNGYVCVALDHPYDTAGVQFPDGRQIESKQITDTYVRTDDMCFVLDELEKMNSGEIPGTQFTDRLDLSHVGVAGMSSGGDAVITTLRNDERFKAGVSLDGGFVSNLKKPVMLLTGNAVSDSWYTNAEGNGYVCSIANTKHWDFADGPLTWKIEGMPGIFPIDSGTSDPLRVTRIISDYTLAFFDKILKGETEPILDGPSSDYPEVTFVSFGDLQPVGIDSWSMY